MTSQIHTQPFTNTAQAPATHLDNVYKLGRTNILWHTLHPNQESIEWRLQALWANAHQKTFSSLEEAKEKIASDLKNIHPLALQKYETAINEASTLDKIKEIAKTSFTQSKRLSVPLAQAINEALNLEHSDKTYKAPSALQIRPLLRKVISSSSLEDAKEAVKNIFQGYSILKQKYKDLQDATTLEGIQQIATNLSESLTEDLKLLKPKIITEKERIIINLKDLWTEVKNHRFSSVDDAIDFVRPRLDAIGLPIITDLYLKDLSSKNPSTSISNKAESYRKDLDFIKQNNLQPTASGVSGYPKLFELDRYTPSVPGFMKHLGGSEEMNHHLLYSFFLDPHSTNSASLKAPQGSMIDQNLLTYTTPSGITENISPEKGDYLKYLISFMGTANTPRSKNGNSIEDEQRFQTAIQTRPIGLFEKVAGDNLASFFCSSYNKLTPEEKQNLFVHLGMMAFLDLILGNSDRLLRLDLENGDIEWESLFDSNLENLMISTNKSLYAIDNGIGDGRNLSQTEEEQQTANDSYLAFLQKILNEKSFETTIATHVLQSLKQSADYLAEEENDNPKTLHDNLNIFRADINPNNSLPWVVEGITTMKDRLKNEIIPIWNDSDERSASLKERLNPNLVTTIQNRLNILKPLEITNNS